VRGRLAALPCTILALSACSFAPAYKVPDSPPPTEQFKEAGDWKPAQPSDAQSRGAWWSIFQDPVLDGIEAQVADANEDLKAAYARLQQARAATRIARSALFPALTVGSSATRSRTSQNSPKFPAGAEPVGNNFDLEADLSYELDVWGRVRNAVSSAKAAQQASAADLATLDLAIHAELANDYFSLRSQDTQQKLLDKTVEDYSKALVLTQNLYTGGAAALTDVAQAQAQLETARTQAADIRLQRAQTEHAIAVLLGRNPCPPRNAVPPRPMRRSALLARPTFRSSAWAQQPDSTAPALPTG